MRRAELMDYAMFLACMHEPRLINLELTNIIIYSRACVDIVGLD